jgi:hypothetical protein
LKPKTQSKNSSQKQKPKPKATNSTQKQQPTTATKNVELILNFLNNQAKDSKRSQELFTDYVIKTLIELLEISSVYTNKIKDEPIISLLKYCFTLEDLKNCAKINK